MGQYNNHISTAPTYMYLRACSFFVNKYNTPVATWVPLLVNTASTYSYVQVTNTPEYSTVQHTDDIKHAIQYKH